jgi:hypothetical protein
VIRTALLALLLLAALPAASAAQPLAVGMRVRVMAPALSGGWISGTVAQVDSAALRMRVPPAGGPLLVPAETLQRLQASRGRGRATLEGAVAGGTLAALVGFFAVQAEGDTGCARGCGGGSGAGFLVGAGAGTLLGALIGSRIPAGPERWRELPLPLR